MFIKNILLNPFIIVSILALSIVFGLLEPDVVKNLGFIGSYYISLLKMIVVPYLFVTITTGVAKVASDPHAKRYTWRLITIYPLAMIFAASLAVGASYVSTAVEGVNPQTVAKMGGILSSGGAAFLEQGEIVTLTGTTVKPKLDGGRGLLNRFVPENIFAALSSGESIKVVIFCIIFGAALARQQGDGRRDVMDVFNVIKQACIRITIWLNVLLPFALFAMVSSQVANIGIGPVMLLGPFVLIQVATGLALLIISALIISNRARVSPTAAVAKVRETLILAITTRSSFACIPIAVRELTENLKLDGHGTDLVLPLGMTICRIGSVPYFVIGTIFIAHLYGVQLTWPAYVTIILSSVAAGFASSGTTGAMGVVLISIVARPLHIPTEAAIALFIAIDPILDVIRTLVLVYGNCALTSIIIPRIKTREEVSGAKPAPL